MSAPEVMLVLEASCTTLASALLAEVGVQVRVGTAPEAARLLAARQVDVVVIDRRPGWQALLCAAESAGGTGVLWGEPPDASERARLGQALLESVCDAKDLPHAVLRALGRVADQRQIGRVAPLVEQAQAIERVGRMAQAIARRFALGEVAEEAARRVRELCDADAAGLYLVEGASGQLKLQAEATAEPAQPGLLEHSSAGAGALRAASGAQSLRFSSQTASEGAGPSLQLAVPLLQHGDVLGVLVVVRHEGREPFTSAQQRWVETLAPHVAIAVQNAHSHARLEAARQEAVLANQDLERKVAERTNQIARAKREWEQTFDAILEPIAVLDGFVIRRANRAFAQQAGLQVQEIPGRICHRVLAHRTTPCPGCPLVAGGEAAPHAEVSLDGRSMHRVRTFAFPEGGVVLHYRDVTPERLLEQKLRESERMAALGQLASGAAHEINNPLGFLISNLKTLDEELGALGREVSSGGDDERPLEQRLTELLDDARSIITESLSGADRVRGIVKALRDLSRQQTRSSASASRLDESVLRALRTEFGEQGARVTLHVQDTPSVLADPLLLDQALGHVFKNARQAVTDAALVRVTVEAEGESALVRVVDRGCGISPEHLHRIFEPFFTTRGIGRGMGLGLTAAYGIVQGLGGSIEVESRLGEGSTFTLRFPQAAPPRSETGEAPAAG